MGGADARDVGLDGRAVIRTPDDKDRTVAVRITNAITVGNHKSIACWCGRRVSGPVEIVDEADRQHRSRHKAES